MDFDEFIEKYSQADVTDLLLHVPHEAGGIDLQEAARQIAARQTARLKLPLWAATRGIRYGQRLNMEQCSSEQTAAYKARIVARLQPQSLADLTGGMGVDFVMMGRALPAACLTYVERDDALCRLARHNFPLLGLDRAHVVCAEAETMLQQLPRQELIFMDPARRDTHGQRTYALDDCTPRVISLLPLLRTKTTWLLLKLSPMLDVQQAVRQLGGAQEVHIVSVEGECKELLILARLAPADNEDPASQEVPAGSIASAASVPPVDFSDFPVSVDFPDISLSFPIHCVNISRAGVSDFLFTYAEERAAECPLAASVDRYIYEPNASVLKAGALKSVAVRYGLRKLAPNSHLYTANDYVPDFPGRHFRFIAEYVPSKGKKGAKSQQDGTAPLTRASITVRNYPLTAEELRRRLRLRDGGPTTLFATTLSDGRHVLLRCEAVRAKE